MKLMYVNGFREDYNLSSTYLRLKEVGFDIEPCQWKYGDDVRAKIDECIKKIKPDMIIASSTAGLFVTDYDIPVILINPVVDRKDLEKLHPDKDFSSYPLQPANKSPYIEVILGEKDEVLDFRKALEFFKDRKITIVTYEGHRLKDIEPVKSSIENYKIFVKKDFKFNPLIEELFTKEELEKIIDCAIGVSAEEILLENKDEEMFEIKCIDNRVEIDDLSRGGKLTKKELFERLNI